MTSTTPRIVEIGLNLISIHEVSDNSHTFEGNVLYHLFWDCMPLDPKSGAKFFRPWIQVHNIREMRHIKNDGMQQLSNSALEAKVAQHIAKCEKENPGKPYPPCKVYENHNFVGQFVSLLDLRNFPFDEQALRITVMCNPTSMVTFTHRVARDANGNAKTMADGKPMRSIKCNLEEDTLSEWNVLLPGGALLEGSKLGRPTPAVSTYEFHEHDPAFSAEGQIYQRLDFKVWVFREIESIMYSVVLPSILLSAACFSIFSLDVVENNNDRFGILFTVILTLVANQFIVGGRLPHLNYLTWVDWVLLSMQLFVYALILQNSICEHLANLAGDMTPQDADLISLWAFLGLYGFMLCMCGLSAYYYLKKRKEKTEWVEKEFYKSFEVEEERFKSVLNGRRVGTSTNNTNTTTTTNNNVTGSAQVMPGAQITTATTTVVSTGINELSVKV
jgi:hypothetical protein